MMEKDEKLSTAAPDAAECEAEKPAPAGEAPPSEGGEPPEPPDPLAQLQRQYDALNDRYLRLMAEYDNFRKRSVKERESVYPEAVAETVKGFLPVVENFERAMAIPCQDENFFKGIAMIQLSLQEILERLCVEAFGTAGELFDPALHNAVMQTKTDECAAGTVTRVLQKGYKIGDRILRYAMVEVAG
jgi:molecular chaperone GrpE